DRGWLLSAQTNKSLIFLACDQIHAPSIQASVLDSYFTLAFLENNALALQPDKSIPTFQREFSFCGTRCKPAPHPADSSDFIFVCSRLKSDAFQRRSQFRFLKTLAKNHLAVEAAVDLV